MCDTKMKMAPSCSPRQAGSKHALFYLEMSIWKFDLRSGQVKFRSKSDNDPSVAKFIFSYGVECRKKGFMLGVQDVGKIRTLIFE